MYLVLLPFVGLVMDDSRGEIENVAFRTAKVVWSLVASGFNSIICSVFGSILARS